MKNKNVLYIFAAPTASGYAGGVITIISSMLEEVERFKRYGYDLEYFDSNVVTSRKPWLRMLESIPVKLWQHILRSRRMLRSVSRYLERTAGRYDLLHFHSSRKWVLLRDLVIICRLGRRRSIPVVLTLHFAEADKMLFNHRPVRKFMLSALGRCVDRIIFLSEMTRQEFISLGIPAENTRVIYTFHKIDMDLNQARLLRSSETPPPQESGRLNLLFMGSIDQRKGIFDLLDALEQCQHRSEVVLHVCGKAVDQEIDSAFRHKLQTIPGQVEFHGYVSGDRKLEILNDADVLILPSYGEGMPIVIMEAMACGCGMIVTDVGAITEIVGAENALIVKPGDVQAIAQGIDRLVEDRELLDAMKKNNLAKARKYTVQYYVQENCALYDEVLAQFPRNTR